MKTLLLIGLIISLSTIKIQAQEWKTINKETYTIAFPPSWELNNSGAMGTEFIVFSPIKSETDKFRENVNFIIQDISEYNLNLDQYVEISEEQVKTIVTDGVIIQSERVKKEEFTYHKLLYSGHQGDFDLQFEQYFFVIDGSAYVLTFTSEKDQFKAYQETGERILNSFSLKEM